MSNACSALVNGVCINGFMALPACDPMQPISSCFSCQRPFERQAKPMCMFEDMPKHWRHVLDDSGKPKSELIERARQRAGV